MMGPGPLRLTVMMIVGIALVASGAVAAEDGLVVHLKFDELSADAKTTPDASGKGNHGRVHGQPLVEGVLGKAMHFEGFPEQIVELGDLKTKAPATVAFWIKTRELTNGRRILSQLAGDASQAGAIILAGQIDVWDGKAWQGVITGGLRHDAWMHVAIVFAADGTATGYLNGKTQKTARCGFEFDGVPAGIGAKFLGEQGNVFNGLVDDLRVYGRALSAEEIRRLASQAVERTLSRRPGRASR